MYTKQSVIYAPKVSSAFGLVSLFSLTDLLLFSFLTLSDFLLGCFTGWIWAELLDELARVVVDEDTCCFWFFDTVCVEPLLAEVLDCVYENQYIECHHKIIELNTKNELGYAL